jgi:hypothetical protein
MQILYGKRGGILKSCSRLQNIACGLIFIIKYNGAFLKPPVPRQIQGPVVKAKAEKVKFVDDGTVAVSIDLKASLVPDPVDRPRPRNFHERTGHILPAENNLLQFYISDTEQFVQENNMVINKDKASPNLGNGTFHLNFSS